MPSSFTLRVHPLSPCYLPSLSTHCVKVYIVVGQQRAVAVSQRRADRAVEGDFRKCIRMWRKTSKLLCVPIPYTSLESCTTSTLPHGGDSANYCTCDHFYIAAGAAPTHPTCPSAQLKRTKARASMIVLFHHIHALPLVYPDRITHGAGAQSPPREHRQHGSFRQDREEH